jgi:hypothetical protein
LCSLFWIVGAWFGVLLFRRCVCSSLVFPFLMCVGVLRFNMIDERKTRSMTKNKEQTQTNDKAQNKNVEHCTNIQNK